MSFVYPHSHHTTIGKENVGDVSPQKVKMRKKMAKRTSREIDQLKDGVKDLESTIEGVCCYFDYCYNGTYPGPKFLLHLKKNTSNLVNVERRAIKTIGGFSSRKSYKVSLSSAQKRNGRVGI